MVIPDMGYGNNYDYGSSPFYKDEFTSMELNIVADKVLGAAPLEVDFQVFFEPI